MERKHPKLSPARNIWGYKLWQWQKRGATASVSSEVYMLYRFLRRSFLLHEDCRYGSGKRATVWPRSRRTWMLECQKWANPHLPLPRTRKGIEKETEMSVGPIFVTAILCVCLPCCCCSCCSGAHSRDLQLMKLGCSRVACQINMSPTPSSRWVSLLPVTQYDWLLSRSSFCAPFAHSTPSRAVALS